MTVNIYKCIVRLSAFVSHCLWSFPFSHSNSRLLNICIYSSHASVQYPSLVLNYVSDRWNSHYVCLHTGLFIDESFINELRARIQFKHSCFSHTDELMTDEHYDKCVAFTNVFTDPYFFCLSLVADILIWVSSSTTYFRHGVRMPLTSSVTSHIGGSRFLKYRNSRNFTLRLKLPRRLALFRNQSFACTTNHRRHI